MLIKTKQRRKIMLKINPSKQMFITLTVASIIMLAVFILTYMSQSTKVHKLQVAVREKQTKLADSRVIAQRLDDVQRRYMDAQSELSSLEKGVTHKAYIPTLLRQIEDLGKGLNLQVVGVRPKAPEVKAKAPVSEDGKKVEAAVEKPKPYDEMILDFEMNGKYGDVMKFVDKINSFPKIIAVQSIDIDPVSANPAEGIKNSPKLSVKLKAIAFILKEEKQLPKTSEEAEAVSTDERI
jgi:Tfp pilus assembly protein PilO